MSNRTRANKIASFEDWADTVGDEDLIVVDTQVLRRIRDLASRRAVIDEQLSQAVDAARVASRSWSEIGTMLGVSKQAAQRKFGRRNRAA